VLSLVTKDPNLYVDTSAYAVHRLPPELVAFLRGRGRNRVMFGTTGRCSARPGAWNGWPI